VTRRIETAVVRENTSCGTRIPSSHTPGWIGYHWQALERRDVITAARLFLTRALDEAHRRGVPDAT
jgi:hypothetical protein